MMMNNFNNMNNNMNNMSIPNNINNFNNMSMMNNMNMPMMNDMNMINIPNDQAISFNSISQSPNVLFNNILNNAMINKNQNKNQEIKLNNLLELQSVTEINRPTNKYSYEEYEVITKICNNAMIQRDEIDDLAGYCSQKIKENLKKGQWFVLVKDLNSINNYEFCFSQIKENDMIIFQCKDTIFYVGSFI